MRNKIYVSVIITIFIGLMVWCPVSFIFDKIGIIATVDIANYKEPAKIYNSDVPFHALLNGIESGKAKIEDIYTNYLPAYSKIVSVVETAEMNFNKALYSILLGGKNNVDGSSQIKNVNAYFLKNGSYGVDRIYGMDIEYENGDTDGVLVQISTVSETLNRELIAAQANEINRLARANEDVNFYVYICSSFQGNL